MRRLRTGGVQLEAGFLDSVLYVLDLAACEQADAAFGSPSRWRCASGLASASVVSAIWTPAHMPVWGSVSVVMAAALLSVAVGVAVRYCSRLLQSIWGRLLAG